MDTIIEQPENKSVTSIVHDFDKCSEKKSQKRENTLISFVMKAIARDQEKNMIISKLQRDVAKMQGLLNLLEMETDVKEQLVKEKEQIIETLKSEIEKLKKAAEKSAKGASTNAEVPKGEVPSKIYKFSDLVISTQNNIVAVSGDKSCSDVTESVEQQKVIDSARPKTKLVKKKSIKKTKEIHVSSFLYNLRNRSKTKSSEKVQ